MNRRVKGGALRIRVVQKQTKKNLVCKKKINGFDICFRFVTE